MLEKSWVRQKDLGHGCLGKSNNWAARDYLLLLYGAGDTIFFLWSYFLSHQIVLVIWCKWWQHNDNVKALYISHCKYPSCFSRIENWPFQHPIFLQSSIQFWQMKQYIFKRALQKPGPSQIPFFKEIKLLHQMSTVFLADILQQNCNFSDVMK